MKDRVRSRRQFLKIAGTGVLLPLAGCSSIGSEPTTEPKTITTDPTTPTTESDTTEESTTEETTADNDEGPGYKDDHWHGRLFFEVNGELVDFRQSKYFLKNIDDENPDTVYFHFHDDPGAHGPNEWSNEKQIVTFQRALNLLPGISYEQQSGEHVVTYEGTTFDATQPGTSVSIHRGTETIDPTTYEVKHNDDFWVQAIDEDTARDVTPAHDGADLGTLVFDVNNLRVDFSQSNYLEANTENDPFHFHDDDHPGLWYAHEPVTLADAVNSLPGISYSQSGDSHAVTYEDDEHPDHSQSYDGNDSETEILIRQRTTDIDPTSYELQADDIIWIYVHSSHAPDNEH